MARGPALLKLANGLLGWPLAVLKWPPSPSGVPGARQNTASADHGQQPIPDDRFGCELKRRKVKECIKQRAEHQRRDSAPCCKRRSVYASTRSLSQNLSSRHPSTLPMPYPHQKSSVSILYQQQLSEKSHSANRSCVVTLNLGFDLMQRASIL